jgi:hypothetical protein
MEDDGRSPLGLLPCSLDKNSDSPLAYTQMGPQGNGRGTVGYAAVARSMVGGGPKSAAVPGARNGVISSQGAPSCSIAASSASATAATVGAIDVDADQEVELSYFGEFPNPDPTDDSQLDISQSFTHYFVKQTNAAVNTKGLEKSTSMRFCVLIRACFLVTPLPNMLNAFIWLTVRT